VFPEGRTPVFCCLKYSLFLRRYPGETVFTSNSEQYVLQGNLCPFLSYRVLSSCPFFPILWFFFYASVYFFSIFLLFSLLFFCFSLFFLLLFSAFLLFSLAFSISCVSLYSIIKAVLHFVNYLYTKHLAAPTREK